MSEFKAGGLAIITGSLSTAGMANVGKTVELVARLVVGEEAVVSGRKFHASSDTAWVVKAEGLVSRARLTNGETWHFISDLALPAEKHLTPIGDDPDKSRSKASELEAV